MQPDSLTAHHALRIERIISKRIRLSGVCYADFSCPLLILLIYIAMLTRQNVLHCLSLMLGVNVRCILSLSLNAPGDQF